MTHLELITLNYLLNALWQVPLIYLVAALAARLPKSAGPQIEHRIWVAALILEINLFCIRRIKLQLSFLAHANLRALRWANF